MYLKRLAFSSCVALSFCAVTAFGQQLDLRLTQIVSGLDFPTYLTHAGDSSDLLFVTEQHGRIRIIQNGILREQPFLNITGRVLCCGERGLLSVAFPPDYANKRYFYVNYTSTPAGATVISRFRTNSDGLTADPNSEQILLTIPQPYANHNGGLNKFGPDGFLYIGMGDGGSSNDPHNNAQNLQSLLGKMLRIDVESSLDAYRIPPSNPFANGSGGRGEIWAYGLRNPWRFSFDRLTGDLFIADVGQDTLEEVDFQPASSKGGENYGWRVLEASRCNIPPADCRRQGTVLPIFEYGRSEGVSITGGYVYRGSRFPNAQGTYLVADYGSGRIWGLRQAGDSFTSTRLRDSGLNISSFGEDQAGELYLLHHDGAPNGAVHIISFGPPKTTAAALTNGASFQTGLVPGSLATIFGSSLTTVNGIARAPSFPITTSLLGTRVTVNGIEAPIVAVANVGGAEQINIQVPFNLMPGQATVVIQNNGSSSTIEATILAAQPGLFANGDGTGAAANSSGAITSQNPAVRGSTITLYGTGFGPVDGQIAAGEAASTQPPLNTTTTPVITIGGATADVQFSGLAPGFAGLYQLNVTIPANAPTGLQEVVATVGGVSSTPVRLEVR